MAIFVGWFMKRELIQEQLQLSDGFLNTCTFIRFVAPIAGSDFNYTNMINEKKFQ